MSFLLWLLSELLKIAMAVAIAMIEKYGWEVIFKWAWEWAKNYYGF